MSAFLAALLGHLVFVAIMLGGALLLFTSFRFDHAVYASFGAAAVFLLVIYWPRR